MGWSLLPKEEGFFELFEEQSDRIHETAKLLHNLIHNWDPNSPLIEKISDLEHEADISTHEIIKKLNSTFITPFDREDIHELGCKMDDVMDLMQLTSSRMHRYHIQKTTEELIQLAEVLMQATDTLKKAIHGLRDFKKPARILEYCIEINRLENAGDQVQELAMGKLFSENNNPIDIIKWKEIYEFAETAIDKCEDVANAIESIIVKQG